MTLAEALEAAMKMFGGPVSPTAYREDDLVGFFPAPRGDSGREIMMRGVGAVVVNLATGEVSRHGSIKPRWPAWLREGGTAITVS